MTWRTPVIAAIALISFIGFRANAKSDQKVLGEKVTVITATQTPNPTVEITPTASPTATLTTSPTASPTAKPTPKPTPTPKPQPEFTPEQIHGFVEKYSILYAVDPNVLRHLVRCESGFNPKAKNYIYAGLFQFDITTWQRYRTVMGLDPDPDLRYHAEEAVRTGTYVLSLGKTGLWPNCYPK